MGVLVFAMSSAFQTMDKSQLLPNLQAIEIKGMALKWFECYLSHGQQCVDWDGSVSGRTDGVFVGC